MDRWASPIVFGLAAWLIVPSIPAQADLSGLLSGDVHPGSQWRMVLTDSPAGSLHVAELAFPKSEARMVEGAGMLMPDGRRIAFTAPGEKSGLVPDEERVTRGAKRGRVIAVERMQPPKDFTAGSILQRSSSLLAPPAQAAERVAFAPADPVPAMVEMASFEFYRPKPRQLDLGLSPMVASLVTNPGGDILASAYAPSIARKPGRSPFDALLGKPADEGRFVPEIGPHDHAWAATALPATVFAPEEQQCLASGIYFEARGESVKGQAAVAQVILNRVRNPAYPHTICGVVYQNKDWRNRCQFSFACDDIRDRVRSREHWATAREVAIAVTAGKIWLPEVGSATHYHAVYVRPSWARSMEKVGRIGLHVFYRTHGGGWS
ncbi:Cell wall hydrolase CwlJ, involved in spore germination [Rhizobium sp. RU35A]|uniref:Cell wall hydrolase n=1 Tax=Rhizobium straminoryzae TaxID=1387186 RepID=A0A549TBN6_9HYPH|nr:MULTISPECIES: cell wall hydrolase [Rhizobium]TRL39292.1 cell wall hydrolase [Rhizobium straminoryzae]SIP99074.1 Cell wall hydrolase CwlJ, involved in spore germination [Rhizobium sp. RU35A]